MGKKKNNENKVDEKENKDQKLIYDDEHKNYTVGPFKWLKIKLGAIGDKILPKSKRIWNKDIVVRAEMEKNDSELNFKHKEDDMAEDGFEDGFEDEVENKKADNEWTDINKEDFINYDKEVIENEWTNIEKDFVCVKSDEDGNKYEHEWQYVKNNDKEKVDLNWFLGVGDKAAQEEKNMKKNTSKMKDNSMEL